MVSGFFKDVWQRRSILHILMGRNSMPIPFISTHIVLAVWPFQKQIGMPRLRNVHLKSKRSDFEKNTFCWVMGAVNLSKNGCLFDGLSVFFNSTKAVHHWSKLPRFPGTVFAGRDFLVEKWVYMILIAWNNNCLHGTNIKRSKGIFWLLSRWF